MPDDSDDDASDETSPLDIAFTARQLNQGAAAARRHGRDPDAALTLAEADVVMRAMARMLRHEHSSARQESSRELRELLDRPPKQVAEQDRKEREQMRADYRFVRRLLLIIGAPVLALAVWAVHKLVSDEIANATRDATTEIRIQRLETGMTRLESRIDGRDK